MCEGLGVPFVNLVQCSVYGGCGDQMEMKSPLKAPNTLLSTTANK